MVSVGDEQAHLILRRSLETDTVFTLSVLDVFRRKYPNEICTFLYRLLRHLTLALLACADPGTFVWGVQVYITKKKALPFIFCLFVFFVLFFVVFL